MTGICESAEATDAGFIAVGGDNGDGSAESSLLAGVGEERTRQRDPENAAELLGGMHGVRATMQKASNASDRISSHLASGLPTTGGTFVASVPELPVEVSHVTALLGELSKAELAATDHLISVVATIANGFPTTWGMLLSQLQSANLHEPKFLLTSLGGMTLQDFMLARQISSRRKVTEGGQTHEECKSYVWALFGTEQAPVPAQ